MKKIEIKIYGLVQGVFFRYYAKEKAREFGVSCEASNEPDGSVTIIAEGEESGLERLLEWCRQGPPPAKVNGVDVKEINATNR